MSCRNLTKQTAHVDVPKEVNNVDSKKKKRERKSAKENTAFRSSSFSSSSCSASSHSSSISNYTTFSKDPEVDITEELTYTVKEVKAPVYNL